MLGSARRSKPRSLREDCSIEEIKRLTVLSSPHLAEQWQGELAEKFHIEAGWC